MEPIRVSSRVTIPPQAMRWQAVRSGGPGGQNVNKVASKVRIRVDLDLIEGLSDAARDRLEQQASPRLDGAGRLVVTSQRTRDQGRNLEDARQKIRLLVASALARPRARHATRPSAGVVARRLAAKRRRAATKQARRAPSPMSDD